MIDRILSLTPWEESLAKERLPVLLYGTGKGAEKISALFSRLGIRLDGVFVSDAFMRGGEFRGMKIRTLEECFDVFGNFVCVPAFGASGDNADVIYSLAERCRVVMPNLPVAGDGRLSKDTLREWRETAQFVIDALADDESRRVMEAVLSFNITGDISYLRDSPVSRRYLVPRSGERYIDVGAYDGDTALEYAALCPDYGDIVALEPSAANYAKLLSNTAGMRIKCLNGGAWKRRIRGGATGDDGRGVSVAENGDGVELYPLDSLGADNIRVGAIKIDAEGAEREVLYGASGTISKSDCEVCCAVYHRSTDIFYLPRLMLYYRPKSRIILRKEKYLPAWDVFATLI